MRNLKRTLSLALAAIMVLGLMVVGASAASFNDFTDKDEVTHKDAVAMITELGILAGLPDGSFGPTQNIDRASFARLVCVVLNGGKEPTLGNLTTTFTDTKGNWAEKYIAYCVDQGIIAGRGNNTFGPSDNVTGSEAAKMLLVALGYNATYEGIGGATWQTTTDVRANQAGLYKDLETMNTSAPLNRDDACQMIYNALMATEVKYELVPSISADGQISMVAQRTNVTKNVGGTTKDVTLLNDKFNTLDLDPTVMTSFSYNDVKDQYTYNFADSSSYTTKLDFTALFGQNVQIIAKNDSDKTVYGMYAVDSTVLASGAKDLIGDIATDGKSVKIDGTSYKIDAANIPAVYYKAGTSAGALNSVTPAMYNFSLIDNDGDNKGDLLVVTPFDLTKVTFVGKDSITFSTGMIGSTTLGNVKTEDVNVYEGAAKDDYVIYVASTYSNNEKATYTKAEVQSATVTGTKSSGTELKIGDTWLKKDSGVTANIQANDVIDYIAFGGVIYYAKITEGSINSNDLAYVITAGTKNGVTDVDSATYVAKLIYADGTKKTVTTDADYSSTGTNLIGKLVTYKTNNDDEVVLTAVNNIDNKAGYDSWNSSTTVSNDGTKITGINGKDLADDAIVILSNVSGNTANASSDAKVITGKEAKNMAYGSYTTIGALEKNVNGFTYAMVTVLTGWDGTTVPSVSDNYGYLLADAYNTVENGKTYRNYTLWTKDGELTVKEESNNGLTGLTSGAIVTFDKAGDGLVKSVKIVTGAVTDAVTGYDNSKLQFNSTVGTYKITNDTAVLYINTKDGKGVEGGSISLADEPTTGSFVNNVRFVDANGDNELDLLIVDVNNKIEAGADTYLGASANQAAINNALNNGDVVINAALTSGATVTVPAGRTLTISAAQTQDSTITVKAGATLVIPNGTLIGTNGAFTATGDVTVNTASNGVQIAASAGTLTLNGNITIDDNDSLTLTGTAKLVAAAGTVLTVDDTKVSVSGTGLNFYDDKADATADSVASTGSYTYTTFTETGTNTSITGWLKNA